MTRPGPKPKYPWLDMAVGETRFIPSDTPAKVRSSAGHQPTRTGRKFETRRAVRDGRMGVLAKRVE